jgi:hypothetical protein
MLYAYVVAKPTTMRMIVGLDHPNAGRTLRTDCEQRIFEQLSDDEIAATIKTLSVICAFPEEEERR